MVENKNNGSSNVKDNPKMKAGASHGIGRESVERGDRDAMRKSQTGSGNVMEDDEELQASEDIENEGEEDTEHVGRAIPAGGGRNNQSSSTKGV